MPRRAALLALGTFVACASPHTTAGAPRRARAVFEVQGRPTPPATSVRRRTRTFTVDTIAPTVTISGPAGPTNDATPTFSFTPSEPGATLQCRIDGGPFAGCTTPYTVALALPDGPHAFEVKATDAVLNAGVATVRAFVVDTVAPAVTITGGPVDTTTSATPQFTFTSADAGATFACRAGAAPLSRRLRSVHVAAHDGDPLRRRERLRGPSDPTPAGNTGPAARHAFAVRRDEGAGAASRPATTPASAATASSRRQPRSCRRRSAPAPG